MLVSGVGPGDEVIVPAMTFCATANAVVHTGARPVFADVELGGLTLDPVDVERRITSRTKAIMPVHLHGRPADMEALRRIADRSGLLLLSDAAHAIETRWRGKTVAQLSDLTCYSFYVTKNMTTVEGGMIATDRDAWAEKIKVYALHGMTQDAWARFSDKGYKHYEVVTPGFKYNMTDIQASFGLHQLRRVEENLGKRERLWRTYDEAFRGLPLVLPQPPEDGTRHALHLYTLRTTAETPLTRDAIMGSLHEKGIGTGVHYTALHLHRYYREAYGYRQGMLPNTEEVGATTFSLPFGPSLTDEEIARIVAAVRAACGV